MKVAAVCFYTPDSWEQLRNVAADKENMDDSYTEWLSGFHQIMSSLKRKGVNTITLNVNIGDLEKWCKQRKLKNTRRNRAKYASEMAEKLSTNS